MKLILQREVWYYRDARYSDIEVSRYIKVSQYYETHRMNEGGFSAIQSTTSWEFRWHRVSDNEEAD